MRVVHQVIIPTRKQVVGLVIEPNKFDVLVVVLDDVFAFEFLCEFIDSDGFIPAACGEQF